MLSGVGSLPSIACSTSVACTGGEAAADGRCVTDAHGCDVAVDVGEEGYGVLHGRRGLYLPMAGQSADVEAIRLLTDAGQAGDCVKADQLVGGEKRLLQHHHERG